MYGGKRPEECVLIFPAEQALHGELANGVEVIGSHGPVSYTHLDVYKRQQFFRVIF